MVTIISKEHITVRGMQSANLDGGSRFLRLNFGRHDTPALLVMCWVISHAFRSTANMSDFNCVQIWFFLGFQYPLAFQMYWTCVLTYLNFDIWQSQWSLIYCDTSLLFALPASIDWCLNEMRQVSTFASVEKIKYRSRTVIEPCSDAENGRKLRKFISSKVQRSPIWLLMSGGVLIGPCVLIINAHFNWLFFIVALCKLNRPNGHTSWAVKIDRLFTNAVWFMAARLQWKVFVFFGWKLSLATLDRPAVMQPFCI